MEHKSETKKGEVTMKGKYLTPNEKLWDEIPKEFLTEQNTWRLLNRQEKALLTEGQLYSYERYWMSEVDKRILREAAVKKGYNEGWEKGKLEGIHLVARKMKQLGLSIADIAKSTGLSEKEIANL